MSIATLDSVSYLFDSPNTTGSPERMLLLAVLERAILDYVGNDQKEALSAQEWLSGEDEEGGPFTFTWLCRELDLNPQSVLATIQAMPKRGNHRIAPWYFARNESWTKQRVAA